MKKLLQFLVMALFAGALFIGCGDGNSNDSNAVDVENKTHYSQPSAADTPSSYNDINLTEGTWDLKMGFKTITSTGGGLLDVVMDGNSSQVFSVDGDENITIISATMYSKQIMAGWGEMFAQFGGIDSSVQIDPSTGFKGKQYISGEDLVIEMWGTIPQEEIDEENANNPTLDDLFEDLDTNATVYKNSTGDLYYITYSGTKTVNNDSSIGYGTTPSTIAVNVTYTAILKKR